MIEATNAVPSTSGINNEVIEDSAETKMIATRAKRNANEMYMVKVGENRGK